MGNHNIILITMMNFFPFRRHNDDNIDLPSSDPPSNAFSHCAKIELPRKIPSCDETNATSFIFRIDDDDDDDSLNDIELSNVVEDAEAHLKQDERKLMQMWIRIFILCFMVILTVGITLGIALHHENKISSSLDSPENIEPNSGEGHLISDNQEILFGNGVVNQTKIGNETILFGNDAVTENNSKDQATVEMLLNKTGRGNTSVVVNQSSYFQN